MKRQELFSAGVEMLKGELDLPDNADVRDQVVQAIALLEHDELTEDVINLFRHFEEKYFEPGAESRWLVSLVTHKDTSGDKSIVFSHALGKMVCILHTELDVD